MTVITLGSQTGGGARLIGPLVAQALGADYVDRIILYAAAQQLGATVGALHQKEERIPSRGERFGRFLQTALERSAMVDDEGVGGLGVPPFLVEEYDEIAQLPITKGHHLEDAKYMEALKSVMEDLANRDNVVIVGRGGHLILRGRPNVLRIGIVANWWDCVARIMEQDHLTRQEAEKTVVERDKARAKLIKRFFGIDDPDSPELYHLVINTSDTPTDYAVDIIVRAAQAMRAGQFNPAGAVR